MPGPDFEIPSLAPPPEPEGADPAPPRRGRRRRAVVPALLVVLGLAAAGTYWATSAGQPTTPAAAPAPRPSPPTPPPPTATTTTMPAVRAPARTCNLGPDEPALQTRPAGSGTPDVTLSFSARVSEDALALISAALADARRTFGDSGTLTVHVHCAVDQYVADSGRPPEEIRSEVEAGLPALVFRGDMWIFGPNYERRSANQRRRIVYHEYFHLVQRLLSRNRSAPRPGIPLWLVEGSARYFEYMVEPPDADTFRSTAVRRFAALPPLSELEQAGGGVGTGGSGEAYAVGAVASDFLVERYGRDALQHDLWVAMARTDWRSAFLEVFGTTVDDFYTEFEAYRQTLRP